MKRSKERFNESPLLKTNPSDGVSFTYDNNEMRTTRDRLRRGESYQPGDTMAWFDESGEPCYLRIDVVHDDDQTLAVITTHPNFGSAVFSTQLPDDKPKNRRLSTPEVDKFCRGPRADLGILLNQVYYDLTQLTVFIPTGAIKQATETGNWSQVQQPDNLILREALQAGVKNFYYQDPPNYQQLFDALGGIVRFVSRRVEDRFSLKFTEINSPSDVTRLLEQVLFIENITPIGNITELNLVMNKYADRLNVYGRAALALFQCWLKENPRTWQDQRVIDE